MLLLLSAVRNCSTGQTKCPNNNVCLERRYLCDGENDCGGNEDENPLFCKNVSCTKGKCMGLFLNSGLDADFQSRFKVFCKKGDTLIALASQWGV